MVPDTSATAKIASPEQAPTPKSAKTVSDDWIDREQPHTIVLFDVDGTLSPSRKVASPEMISTLKELKKKVIIGYVGGSDLAKQKEQLGEDAATHLFDFGFSENGATAFRKGEVLDQASFIKYVGEEKYKKLVNWTLHYLADLDIPIKRGTFVEYRNAMINVSPIGRNCSYEERLEFASLDEKEKIREKIVEAYEKEFADFGLQFSIGGQISIDIFPKGWDKTYCLRHLEKEGFKEIHFFGDKTEKGGNDYEIFNHPMVTGHAVKNPNETLELLRSLFKI